MLPARTHRCNGEKDSILTIDFDGGGNSCEELSMFKYAQSVCNRQDFFATRGFTRHPIMSQQQKPESSGHEYN